MCNWTWSLYRRASGTAGPPQSVALYDADGRLAHSYLPASWSADAASVREWAFLGWIALADLATYLRRDSLWEAHERLHQARLYIWRLWAVAQEVPYPVFGLTSLLDTPTAALPPDSAAMIASLDSADLYRAARVCAALLDKAAHLAAVRVGGTDLPSDLAGFVQTRLMAVDFQTG